MMRVLARWLTWTGAGVVALAVTAGGLAPGAAAAPAAVTRAGAASAAQPGPVSPNAASGTPALVHTGSSYQEIRQLVQCGGTMYAVGAFAEITQNGTTYKRNNVFSFSATAPYTVTSWNPNVNGRVDSIALNSTCTHAYIGGRFTQVSGSTANRIAYLRTYNSNALVSDWPHNANGEVNTLLLTGTHLLAGGFFTSVNGSKRPYYVSLNSSTGKDDSYIAFSISGHYSYTGVSPNPTMVYNQQLSPLGGHVLVEGTFTTVESNPRQQIFMLNLGGSHANVNNWYSTAFNEHCATTHPFYVQAAAWSPDATTVYVADTGFAPFGWKGTFPLTGLCDAAAAFPANRTGGLSPQWINYTGCDSLYSVASDGSAVYVGGHPRWSHNAFGCNGAGQGAIADRGLQGLMPDGTTMVNPDGSSTYTMARNNADDMLITGAGLWIASSNRYGEVTCGRVSGGGHAGICFLPYS
jgi:hypothetical protein